MGDVVKIIDDSELVVLIDSISPTPRPCREAQAPRGR